MVYLRDRGPTEIGAFGIADPQAPLVIVDVILVPQECTAITVKFDDAGVADFFDEQVDRGRRPEEFARLWLHTHPGDSALPSSTDEATFTRVFGKSDWAVMFILAHGGETYARLRFRAGPGGQLRIPVDVDYGQEFVASDQAGWNREYQSNVRTPLPELPLDESDSLVDPRFESRLWDGARAQDWSAFDDPFFLREGH